MSLTQAQVDTLLRPIKPRRVLKAQGQSHVPAYDVTAHLSRVFGFAGWDKEILSLDLVHERCDGQPSGKDQGRWWVTYRCVMRLVIRDPHGAVVKTIDDAATGSAQNMPTPADAHDFAVKNAVSYALKRCAKDLGDQFGLSLYNGGSVDPLVGRTLVMPGEVTLGAQDETPDVEAHVPEPTTLGNDERQELQDEDGDPDTHVPVGSVEEPSVAVPCTKATWDRLVKLIQVDLDETQAAVLQDWAHSQGWKVTRRGLTEEQALELERRGMQGTLL